jgi:hypothetical protein
MTLRIRRIATRTKGPLAMTAVSLSGVALLGCSEPFCDICTTSAIVYGTVSRSGSPVSGASVMVTPIRNSCSSGEPVLGWDLTTSTVADGSYRAHSHTPDTAFTACIRVSVLESGSAGGSTVIVDGGTVQFRRDEGGLQRRKA